jgi:opacity protein-like surface antigen
MSRAIRLLAVAAAAALAASSVQAQDVEDYSAGDIFTAGAEAYEEGKASSMRPVEPAEIAYCAGYWNVWSDAVGDGTVAEERIADMPVLLKPPGNAFQTIAIFTKLTESDTLNDDVEEGRVEARKFLKDALAGDVDAGKSLFGVLGTCQV